jgi:hypothetical protein
MHRVLGVILNFGLLVFVGCSKPPEIPVIGSNKPEFFPEIALRDTLTAEDFRKIFNAVNQTGRLNGLKKWFEKASDHDLNTLGKAANLYLYQDSLDSGGLPKLIENRIFSKTFSNLSRSLENLDPKKELKPLNQILRSSFTHPSFSKIIRNNSYIFDPDWLDSISQIRLPKLTSSEILGPDSLLLTDLKRATEDPAFEQEGILLAQTIRTTEIGKNIFLSLQDISEKKGTEALKDLSQSFSSIVKSSSKSDSILTRGLTLADLLNRPSQGLFSEAQETLKTADGETLVRLMAERFEPLVLRGAAGFIRETLKEPFDDVELDAKFWLELPRKNITDPPTENLRHLCRRIQFAMDKMANSSQINKDASVILNSFLLTEWFESYAKENKDILSAISKEKFKDDLWATPIKHFSFSINLLELDEKGKPTKDSNGKLVLSPKIESELKALDMEEFANDLKVSIKRDSFGPTLTKISSSINDLSLKKGLAETLNSLHRAHPIADPVPFLASLAFLITRPNEGSPILLADLETPNMLNSIQNFLRGLSFTQLRKLVTFAFEDLEIGNLSEEDRERLKSLYPNNPSAQDLLDSLLQNLEVIHDLDRHLPEQISLLEFYHSILSNSRTRDIKGFTALFKFLHSTQLFDVKDSKGKYPSVIQAFTQEEKLTQLVEALAKCNPSQEEAILKVFHSLIGNRDTDITDLFSFLKGTLLADTQALKSALSLIQNKNWNVTLSREENEWLFRFINSDLFFDLHHALVEINDSQQVFQLAAELETLQQDGELENIFKVLGNMKSDRIQRLALVLWEWEKSHELKAAFALIKNLTKS